MLERPLADYSFRIIDCESLKHANAPHLVGLLCTPSKGQCRHAAEKGKELAPPHAGSIARRAGLEEHAPDHSHVSAAEGWYRSPEYQKIKPLRLNSTVGNVIIVDGPE